MLQNASIVIGIIKSRNVVLSCATLRKNVKQVLNGSEEWTCAQRKDKNFMCLKPKVSRKWFYLRERERVT